MQLYLLRHGPARSRKGWDGPDDLRPLTRTGEATTHAVARRIAELDLGLDAILTSPYERALRTAVIVQEELGNDIPFAEEPRLRPAEFTSRSLAEMLEPYGTSSAVMVVGHEPSMTEVLGEIVGGGQHVLRKAGLARVDLQSVSPPNGTLKWLAPPRLLQAE